MFGHRKKTARTGFDKTGKRPVIRSSICTGEQVAGFQDEKTGKFLEVMLIRGPADLKTFMAEYDLKEEIGQVW